MVNNYFVENALAKYNPTYLRRDLVASKNITKGVFPNTFKPIRKYLDEMSDKYSFVPAKSEDVVTDDSVLPDSLLVSTRGYLENLGKQINASYNHNIFDGCAVLMRRMIEILLIHSYETVGKLTEISDSDGLKNLNYIINYTISNKPFRISKETSEVLDEFRQIGNFSAHKVQYNAKRKDIENIRLKFRVAIEELLYTSNLKK
jgi:hypothetical protein